MGKFALICQGTRATKPVTVALRAEPEPSECRCLVRPLNGSEEAGVLESAIAFAKSRGVEDPTPGDQLYEFGIWVHTIVIGCLDEEAPHGPYFGKCGEECQAHCANAIEQVLEHLDRDRIALLYELQQTWQDECSPRQHNQPFDDFVRSVVDIASQGDDAELPFERWSPVLRRSWVRTTADLLLKSNALSSRSGSDSEQSTSNSSGLTH